MIVAETPIVKKATLGRLRSAFVLLLFCTALPAARAGNPSRRRDPQRFNRRNHFVGFERQAVSGEAGDPLERHQHKLRSLTHVDLRKIPLPRHRVLYDKAPSTKKTGWPASNEFDFFAGTIDSRPADIFAGFGNNHVWDLAMRRRAKTVVLADRDPGVLKTQHLLYKPLLRLTRTPAEFVSVLAGVPLPQRLRDAPVEQAFAHIAIHRSRLPTHERLDFIDSIVRRMKADPAIDEHQRAFVEYHLTWSIRPGPKGFRGFAARGRPAYRGGLSAYGDQRTLFYLFRKRYDKNAATGGWRVRRKRRESRAFDDPLFSVLSSQANFDWLKGIFEADQVYYIVADIRDAGAYRALGAFAREQQRKVSGLATSNIFDASERHAPHEANRLAANVARLALQHAETDASFTLYRTRRTTMDHRFEQYELPAAKAIVPALARYGNSLEPGKSKLLDLTTRAE